MSIARVGRNVILAGMAWRLIAQRRNALARERRARRIAPLLIAAGGTGVILATRPRILEGARRLWEAARRQLSGDTNSLVRESRRAVEKAPRVQGKGSLHDQQEPVSFAPRQASKSRAPSETEPMPGVKKLRKRVARAEQTGKGRGQPMHGAQAKGDGRPGTQPGESLKH